MNVIHVSKGSRKLANMFMRMQEFYESPEFRGKIFTKREFLSRYKETKGTRYHEDWAGFNLPGWVIETFRHGCFDPLNKDERELLEICDGFNGSFYVIGTERGGDDIKVLRHELAHSMFYLSPEYRSNSLQIIENLSNLVKTTMTNWLAKTGYHKNSFPDEMQAYILCDEPNRYTKNAHQSLNLLYAKHFDELNIIDFKRKTK